MTRRVGLDPGIAPYVKTLQASGVETFESCEGGPGHAYTEPVVRFFGDKSEGFRALCVALQHGYPVSLLGLIVAGVLAYAALRFWTDEHRAVEEVIVVAAAVVGTSLLMPVSEHTWNFFRGRQFALREASVTRREAKSGS